MQDFLLLSFRRAGPDALRSGLCALAGSAALIGLAFAVVLVLAPQKVPSRADQWVDSPVGSVNRLGKVVYGPGPSDVHCRRFQFDNRTATLEEAKDMDCAAALARRPKLDGQASQANMRDASRR